MANDITHPEASQDQPEPNMQDLLDAINDLKCQIEGLRYNTTSQVPSNCASASTTSHASAAVVDLATLAANSAFPGAGVAVSFGVFLSHRFKKSRKEKAHRFLELLGATWEKICVMQLKHKYPSVESASHFVSLVEQAIQYELNTETKSTIACLFSGRSKALGEDIDALKDMEFHHRVDSE